MKTAAAKKQISDYTFVRQFKATKGNHVVSIVTQPYITGMYVAISDKKLTGGFHQMSLTHKAVGSWIKKVAKGFEQKGYKTETVECKYVDFIKEEELNRYNVLEGVK